MVVKAMEIGYRGEHYIPVHPPSRNSLAIIFPVSPESILIYIKMKVSVSIPDRKRPCEV
jgi:hypothetical protein